jgi:hypothetical protein
MRLIKIDNHYYVIDDSEIKEGDCRLHLYEKTINLPHHRLEHGEKWATNYWRKITHSTRQLEGVTLLNLSDVEEVINGYNVEKMAGEIYPNWFTEFDTGRAYNGFIKGFNACQKLMKDKMFTANDMLNAYREGTNAGACHESLMDYDSHDSTDAEEFSKREFEEFKKSLRSKTKWEIEIVDGEIIVCL